MAADLSDPFIQSLIAGGIPLPQAPSPPVATGGAELAMNNPAGMRVPGAADGGGPATNPGGWQHFASPEAAIAGISHQLDRYASGATSERLTGTATPLNT